MGDALIAYELSTPLIGFLVWRKSETLVGDALSRFFMQREQDTAEQKVGAIKKRRPRRRIITGMRDHL